jgi:hypothetical protein
MTDWLDEILDHDPGEAVPEGFASRVLRRVEEEQRPTPRLLRFPVVLSSVAAAILLVAAGFWLGQGAKPVEPLLGDPSSSDSASLELAELYSYRGVLRDLEIASDADLDLVFLDEAADTWILDEAVDSDGEEER